MSIRIQLLPLGKTLSLPAGSSLQEALFAQGVEFPCGGRGRCRGCKIRVIRGILETTTADRALLSSDALEEGWRLACCARPNRDCTLEVAQWESPILADNTTVPFSPRDGLGIAIDLGTTTIVTQLVDLRDGTVLGVEAALNRQARHGADLMSRIDFALTPEGRKHLSESIRGQLGGMIRRLLAATPVPLDSLTDVVLVGNTVMHHLFCGLDVASLAHYPFNPATLEGCCFEAGSVGWGAFTATVRFLPNLGGFVGSDLLAGILATRLATAAVPAILIDLGTNGEVVLGNSQGILCASTAAGPAFEGARISMGMRAATGAISRVEIVDGKIQCHIQGPPPPRGICGSGLVDAVAAGLNLAIIQSSGKFAHADEFALHPPVRLTQRDIRELQLAKAAITAGIRILVEQWGTTPDALEKIYLAGAFGNYVDYTSARRIGLIPFPPERIHSAGNTALIGAKIALLNARETDLEFTRLRTLCRHVSLSHDARFQEIFIDEMGFPEPECG